MTLKNCTKKLKTTFQREHLHHCTHDSLYRIVSLGILRDTFYKLCWRIFEVDDRNAYCRIFFVPRSVLNPNPQSPTIIRSKMEEQRSNVHNGKITDEVRWSKAQKWTWTDLMFFFSYFRQVEVVAINLVIYVRSMPKGARYFDQAITE